MTFLKVFGTLASVITNNDTKNINAFMLWNFFIFGTVVGPFLQDFSLVSTQVVVGCIFILDEFSQ